MRLPDAGWRMEKKYWKSGYEFGFEEIKVTPSSLRQASS
jgi:hypothetical protein